MARVVVFFCGALGTAIAHAQAPTDPGLVSVTATIAQPVHRATDLMDRSPGLRLSLAGELRPTLAIIATVDHMFMDTRFPEGDVGYEAAQAGVRVMPRSGNLAGYGELVLGLHRTKYFHTDPFYAVGMRVSAGLMYYPQGKLFASLGLGYCATQPVAFTVDSNKFSLDTIVLDFGFGRRF